jgi:arabinogalactan endo-1,4-beta-galactosidase
MIRFYCLAILFVFTTNTLLLAQTGENNKQQPGKNQQQKPAVLPAATEAFSLGGDVSWLPQMEATGFKFYDTDGTEKDCLQLLKDRGMNTIRLRVFVNPSNNKASGHCSKKETVQMALRAQKMGMRVMIDFHYSDTWADPGKQAKPAAWANHAFPELLNDLYTHTFEVLDTLKTTGIIPEWVQIGNEIPGGMLWPDGSTKNWPQLAQLLNKGYEATKAVDKSIKVIVHIDQGNNNERFRYFFDNATSNGVKYDVIGLSYYPFWIKSDYTATIADLRNNLLDMVSRYQKEVMVVEVGGEYTKVQNTYDMLVEVIKAVKDVPDNKGLGVIYWEPQGANSWSHYKLSCWQDDGKPSPALDAFLTGSSE